MSEIKDIKKAAASFVSEEVSSQVLPAGEHRCVLLKAYVIHSMMDNKGNPKENKTTEYQDVTTQVYTEFGSTENKGAIANRYNIEGFLAYDKLSDEEKESGKFTCSEDGYAMIEKNGKFYRVNSEENTAAAHRILSDAFKAMGIPVGSGLEAMDDVIAEKREVIVVVKDNDYNGKTTQVVSHLKTAVAVEEAAEFN